MRFFVAALWLTVGSVMQSAAGEGQVIETVAIWPFESASIGEGGSAGDSAMLREVLAELLGENLIASDAIRVVERERLNAVLAEQKVGATELADEETRLRLGRLSGAKMMVFGNYINLGGNWQLDLRVVDTESAQVLHAESRSGEGEEYVAAIRDLAAQLFPPRY